MAALWCNVCGVAHARTEEESHTFYYQQEDTIPNGLKDPVSFEPLFDAVVLPCDHTFSRAVITQSIRMTGPTCPLCKDGRAQLKELKRAPVMVRTMLDELKVQYY